MRPDFSSVGVPGSAPFRDSDLLAFSERDSSKREHEQKREKEEREERRGGDEPAATARAC